ncbi:hypothetical protein D3C76_1617400 [compost metagenome]
MVALTGVGLVPIAAIQGSHLRIREAVVEKQHATRLTLQRVAQGVSHARTQVAQAPVGSDLDGVMIEDPLGHERHQHRAGLIQLCTGATDARPGNEVRRRGHHVLRPPSTTRLVPFM